MRCQASLVYSGCDQWLMFPPKVRVPDVVRVRSFTNAMCLQEQQHWKRGGKATETKARFNGHVKQQRLGASKARRWLSVSQTVEISGS